MYNIYNKNNFHLNNTAAALSIIQQTDESTARDF